MQRRSAPASQEADARPCSSEHGMTAWFQLTLIMSYEDYQVRIAKVERVYGKTH